MSATASCPVPTNVERCTEAELVAALRRREEPAFVALVERYGPSMHRLAMTYVRSRASAEEIVQETWCAVLGGIDGFEQRSSFKTWLFRILINRATTRAQRERRSTPFSAFAQPEDDGPAVSADRFLPADHPRYPCHWAAAPSDWSRIPEDRLMTRETLRRIRAAIGRLPRRQQEVLVLRDIEGWPAEEVCEALNLTETNQRVLLHRARSRIRAELERYLDAAPAVA